MQVKFLDLKKQYRQIKEEIDKGVIDEIAEADYILGRSLFKFEKDFAKYCQAKYCVGVDSGTSALYLALKTVGIKKGDEVITCANTFVSTLMAIEWCQAKAVLVDCDENGLIDINKISQVISKKSKAIIPVDLYGQPTDIKKIRKVVGKKIKIIEDAAQAHGSRIDNTRAGKLADLTCFSFYPSKNLGAYGDGGAITTNNKIYFDKLKSLRNYGSSNKYYYNQKGFNHRLDSLQAKVLEIKLGYLDEWNRKRQRVSDIYRKQLNSIKQIRLLVSDEDFISNNYVFPIFIKDRDKLRSYLADWGIETLIHYPRPIYLQEAYMNLGYKKGNFLMTESICDQELSLPIYPELSNEQIMYVCEKTKDYYEKN